MKLSAICHPHTPRRSEPSPSPDVPIEDEPVALNGVVEKVEQAAHSVQHYATKMYWHLHRYIPHALLHHTKSEYYLMFSPSSSGFTSASSSASTSPLLSPHLPRFSTPPTSFNPSQSGNRRLVSYSYRTTRRIPLPPPQTLSNISAPKASMMWIHLPSSSTFFARFSHDWGEHLHRAGTKYASRSIGVSALLIQSLAALHAYLHLTCSPVPITASQIFSPRHLVFRRIFPHVQSSPWYALMLLAWCGAETIRSTYYLLSLLRLVPPTHATSRPLAVAVNVITTLRYTTFYALYPLGAGSEYALLLKGFPSFPTRQSALLKMGQYASLVAGVSNPPAWRVLAVRLGMWVEQ